MKRKFIFLSALLSMVLAIAFTSCKKNNDTDPNSDPDDQQIDTSDNSVNDDTIVDILTVYDVIVQADSFDYLVNAIQEADLVETLKQQSADYTIFVPTQAAIDYYVLVNEMGSVANISDEIWLNHIISGSFSSSELGTGYMKTMAKCGTTTKFLDIYLDTENGVLINGQSNVISSDNTADNGVIHVVDAVIGTSTLGTFLSIDPELSLYYDALYFEESNNNTNLINEIGRNNSDYTFFAPTNTAFQAFLSSRSSTATSWEEYYNEMNKDVNNSPIYFPITENVLLSSEITSETEVSVYSKDYYSMIFFLPSEEDVLVVSIREEDNNSTYLDVEVIEKDIIACNGVLHKVDNVIRRYRLDDVIGQNELPILQEQN